MKDDELRAALGRFTHWAAEVQVRRAAFHESVTEDSLTADFVEFGRLYGDVQARVGPKLREYL
ncbi:MAG: hypothetical protein ACYDCI_00500 [Candidatus Limnocylindrales bacterium]